MPFIKLTNVAGDPIFVRPELIAAFGPSRTTPATLHSGHRSWIYLHGDARDIYVREAPETLASLLNIEIM